MLEEETDTIGAESAGREHLPLSQGRLMGIAVAIMLNPIYPRNRNRFRWLVSLLSHSAQPGEQRDSNATTRSRSGNRKQLLCGAAATSISPDSPASRHA